MHWEPQTAPPCSSPREQSSPGARVPHTRRGGPHFVETDGRGDEVRVVPDAASPVRPVRVTEDPLPLEWVVPRRGGRARSPKDCDTYASVQSSYDDLASLASERCCDEDPRSPDAALDDAYRRYVAARDAPAADADAGAHDLRRVDDAAAGPPRARGGRREPRRRSTCSCACGVRRPCGRAVRLGARKIGDLRYLRKEDYAGVGLDLGDLDMKVQF